MKNLAFAVLAFTVAMTQVRAEDLNNDALWKKGLNTIEGTYKYIQISSPGGLWQKDEKVEVAEDPNGAIVIEGKKYRIVKKTESIKQVSMNEIPAALREKLTAAEITFKNVQKAKIESRQTPSPGDHGRPPYNGMLRYHDEFSSADLVMKNLPGIGILDGDEGNYSGKVDLTLTAAYHSDPSDSGIFSERMAQEMIWGVAAQARNYALLDAIRKDVPDHDDPVGQVMANARLLRYGQEIVSYIEVVDSTDAFGSFRKIWGSIRLSKQ